MIALRFFVTTLFVGALSLLIEPVMAVCQPINGWTALCDVGINCGVTKRQTYPDISNVCCSNISECQNVDPQTLNYSTHDFSGAGTGLVDTRTTPGPSQKSGSSISPFDGCPNKKVNTAFGCIDAKPEGLFRLFFRLGIGIAGGIAFLLIMFGGFQIMTSAGNPEHLNEGKELVSSAIAGLLMVIFSVFLLQVIGVHILCIPGFGSC